MFEVEFRLFSEVRRWATIRNSGQKLAEHSFFVALYADQIATLIDWQGDRGALMLHALLHDIDELITGDIPGNWKRKAAETFDKPAQMTLLYQQLRCGRGFRTSNGAAPRKTTVKRCGPLSTPPMRLTTACSLPKSGVTATQISMWWP